MGNWAAQADPDAGRRSDGLTVEEPTELAQLRRRLKVLKREKEIPKSRGLVRQGERLVPRREWLLVITS